MNNIKSTTEVTLPFGSMRFMHGKWLGKWQTTYQLVFEGSSHFDLDQHQPTCWKHLSNRRDVRNLMISEGDATLEEANGYINILVGRQWNRRKGKHSMTINKGERY